MLDHKLVIVSGKGGVGKSAVAAGLALMAQRRGLRVLAVEMDMTTGLASHFSTGELAFEPREVVPGLHAMRVVRSEALLEYLTIQLRIPGLGRFGGGVARAFDALATAAPAIREIITIGKVLWEVREEKWDVVVVDGPPTGQIGSYLRAPKSISELVPTGRIQGQAGWMAEALADPATTKLVLVTLPEELPTTETMETMAWLEAEGVAPAPTILVNRVLPEVQVTGRPAGMVGDMVDLHTSQVAEQVQWRSMLPGDLELPYLFGLFTPGEVAAQMSDLLEPLA